MRHPGTARLLLIATSVALLGCNAATSLTPAGETIGKRSARTGTVGKGAAQAGTGTTEEPKASGSSSTNPGGQVSGGAGAGTANAPGTGTTAGTQQGTAGTSPVTNPAATTATPTPPPVNPATQQGLDQQTGQVTRGTVDALVGEKPISTPAPSAVKFNVLTADGTPANYFFAGNTVFIEATGLKPGDKYRATLLWPDGSKTAQEFVADEGGNMTSKQGKFIEYPHAGFYNREVKPGETIAVTGEFKMELRHITTDAVVGERPFAVRTGPIIFTAGIDRTKNAAQPVYTQRTLYFSDTFEEVYLHGEGFEPGTQLVINMIKANVNRQNPMQDGLKLSDKLVQPYVNLTYQCNAKGVFDAKVNAWFKTDPVADSMVVIGKFLNDSDTFVRGEDIAITDHPTFLIKDSKEFFKDAGIAPGATPPPAP